MKQFSLEEYLKNSSKKVVTRDGRKVKIRCTNLVSDNPVVAQIDGTGYSLSYPKDGKCSACQNSIDDLFFAPEKCEGWINIFKNSNDTAFLGENCIYSSKEDAEREGMKCDDYVSTVKVEWEE